MSTGFFCICPTNNLSDPIKCAFEECEVQICSHIYKQKIIYCHNHALKIFDSPEREDITDEYWIGLIQAEVKSVGEYRYRYIEEIKYYYYPQSLKNQGIDFERGIRQNISNYGKYAVLENDKILLTYWVDGKLVDYKLRFHYVMEDNYNSVEQYDYFLISIEKLCRIKLDLFTFRLTARECKVLLYFLFVFKKITCQIMPVGCLENIAFK